MNELEQERTSKRLARLRLGRELWIRPWLKVVRMGPREWHIVCHVCPMGGYWLHQPRSRGGIVRAIRCHAGCGLLN